LSAYSGQNNERNPVVQSNLLTRSALHEMVQASDEEIELALNSLETIEINGWFLQRQYSLIHSLNLTLQVFFDSLIAQHCVR
jgi:hypothetical protein